ncbi:gamma-glutamyl-gamma-aminobutyrate hydrolase family protein [Burkholderia sp. AU33545]|uniref:gamma-glutamyl-gamma-aminobutyrate hydrolase family protein n=1 Tax=Burkholderia sp. AU33545 TaxID=2879631 RepID=UPI001CF43E0B|nr:gamma-glutamyl-gamma-aminobutyrate hydrolase family protein [Burkholderia sp. AU33545]MCA8202481.1 gamma-glutamyl-gamma-aminobutyrate hydrolase family protein [Burkholderia sp. AU33545]
MRQLPEIKPVVGVLCSAEDIEIPGWGCLSHQAVFDRYLQAATEFGGVLPLLIGSTDDLVSDRSFDTLLDRLDGIVLPGGASNIDVAFYGGTHPHVGSLDRLRDRTAIRVVREAVTSGRPVFGICRGMQEINVALGGTLYATLHDEPGRMDHRANRALAFEERYRDAHAVELVSGGWLDEMLRTIPPECRQAHVNSLHGQGIAALANGLSVDAYADDGTIEAVSHIRAPIFGVQWHPEWYVRDSVLNRAVWARFGRECAAYLRRRFDDQSCRDTSTGAGNIPKDGFSEIFRSHGHLF